jgi:hypothetical protein
MMLPPSRCYMRAVDALVAVAVSAVAGIGACCSGSSGDRSSSCCGIATASGGCPCWMCLPLESARLLSHRLQQTHPAWMSEV